VKKSRKKISQSSVVYLDDANLLEMGTRHLTIVKHEEEIKVAQYGQWDGYPDGAGINILGFLSKVDLDHFKERLSLCEWATDDTRKKQIEVVRKYTSVESLPDDIRQDGFLSMDESKMLEELYPESHRDTGSLILELIADGHFIKRAFSALNPSGEPTEVKFEVQPGKIFLDNSIAFASDRVFCEWAWVIDLDTNELQVYTGQFNYDGSKSIFEDYDNPVRLLTTFDIDTLPDEAGFLSQCEAPEVTEEEALDFIEEIQKQKTN
jgi:hypothetical protein